jgi:membrane-bound lytic murein transglycosylase F
LIGARRAQGIDYRRLRRSEQVTNRFRAARVEGSWSTIVIIVRRSNHDFAAIDLPSNVRPPRRAFVVAAGIAAALAAAAALTRIEVPPEIAKRLPVAAPERAKELVVLVRPGPVVYFPGVDGRIEGLDADLLRLYAAERKLALRFVAIATAAELEAALASGDAHLGAGGLFERPAGLSAAATSPPTPEAAPRAAIAWTSGYYSVEPVLIYNTEGFKPGGWDDLDGETVALADSPGEERDLEQLRAAHPDVEWERVQSPSPVELIARVSDGTLNYAIVGSLAAAIARNIYLDFDVAFPAGGHRSLAWAVSTAYPGLCEDLDRFLARVRRDGTLERLIERYVPDASTFLRLDASGLIDRLRTVLPQYQPLFRDAQEKTGIEWRLLAALAFQESKWDSAATSETGVRGFMQLTEDTAKRMGVTNLLDPAQNILAGARYLNDLKARLPGRIQEPDRTWLALAAYNIGLGHLEDARILAQRQGLDPDHWTNVKKVLPLLALPEHYERAKLGYARGGMPVAFVDRVRGYYDVLLAHEAPLAPRLRSFTDAAAAPADNTATAQR